MSSNTPNQPGGGSDNIPPNDPQAGGHDPLANNPYSVQHRQAPAPDLDANAPVLKSYDLARMNRRAMMFLGVIVAMLLALAFWLFQSGSNRNNAPKPKAETVVVPEAPLAPPLPPQTPVLPLQQAQPPIPLVSGPQLPMRPATQNQGPQVSSLVQRRIDDTGDTSGGSPPTVPGTGTGSPLGQATSGLTGPGMPPDNIVPDKPTSAEPLNNPDTLLVRGTFIRCVLQTRIVTDYAGFSSCIVTEPVYSFDGRRLLLPKGSKVLGKYGSAPNSDRVAVFWDRIVTPNGIDVNMESPGVDDLGGMGYTGYVDSHWASRISSALLISVLSDAFSYEAAKHGPATATVTGGAVVETPFQSNTAATLQELAGQSVRRSANRPVTITINQGTIVDIYVAKDVDFSGVVSRF